MRSFTPSELSQKDRHALLLSGVGPRPIALVSTVSDAGVVNLSPFSFFNIFSSNPPMVVFSPSFRGTDGSAKDTFRNILSSGECTISAVSHSIVHQVNLASANWAPEVDEYAMSGLTPHPSDVVAPPFVRESPFAMECRLRHHYPCSDGLPGSGNLMICEVVRFHFAEWAFSEGQTLPSPKNMDLVARMGGNWYARANDPQLFELPAPRHNGIGVQALPHEILTSPTLTGAHLAVLASVPEMPVHTAHRGEVSGRVAALVGTPLSETLLKAETHDELRTAKHNIAAACLAMGAVDLAWEALLAS